MDFDKYFQISILHCPHQLWLHRILLIIIMKVTRFPVSNIVKSLLSVPLYISHACSLFPSFWSCDVFILIKFLWHFKLTQPHWWHFQGKAELSVLQCPHHWTLSVLSLLPEWTLTFSYKFKDKSLKNWFAQKK